MVERICCVSTWSWCWSRLPKDDWCSTRRRSRKCVHNLSTQQKHNSSNLLDFCILPCISCTFHHFQTKHTPKSLIESHQVTNWRRPSGIRSSKSVQPGKDNALPENCINFYISSGWEASFQQHAGSTNLSLVQRALSLCKGQVILVERHPRKRQVLSHHCTSVEANVLL